MKRLLRVIIILLLLVIVASLIYTQSRTVTVTHPVAQPIRGETSAPANAVAQIVALKTPTPTPVMGSESAPLYVKFADAGAQVEKNAQDRQTEQNLEHYALRIAASSLAQNIVMCVEAVLLLLILIVLYMLVESVKRLTSIAEKAVEVASSQKQQTLPMARVKHPPHHYRKR